MTENKSSALASDTQIKFVPSLNTLKLFYFNFVALIAGHYKVLPYVFEKNLP